MQLNSKQIKLLIIQFCKELKKGAATLFLYSFDWLVLFFGCSFF